MLKLVQETLHLPKTNSISIQMKLFPEGKAIKTTSLILKNSRLRRFSRLKSRLTYVLILGVICVKFTVNVRRHF